MKNKTQKKQTKQTLGAPTTRREWLEIVIKLTQRAIDPNDSDDGNGMNAQLARFTKELKGLKKA